MNARFSEVFFIVISTSCVHFDRYTQEGKESNKHRDKKLRAGRSGVGKSIVIGGKDRATNKVSATTIESTARTNLQGFVAKHTDVNATVYTDEHRGYFGMPYNHETVKHSISE